METAPGDYEDARAKLAELPDDEVERIAGSSFGRSPDAALLVALSEELARRGLKRPEPCKVRDPGW